MPPSPITTRRLLLVPASAALLRDALAGDDCLAHALGALLPADWPPEFYDADSLHYTLDKLASEPGAEGWAMHFFLRRADHLLIGNGGYYAPPVADGTVEVGYSVVPSMQRKGYATEATQALVERAFADPRVRRVVASTMPDRLASIRVIEKLGFARLDASPAPGVLQYGLDR